MSMCVLGTNHKSGTSWMFALCTSFGNFEQVETNYISFFDFFDTESGIATKVAFLELAKTKIRGKFLLNRTGYCPPSLQVVSPCPVVRMIRDPRDMIVSAYFSHLYSHKKTQKSLIHNEYSMRDVADRLQAVSLSDGLLFEMDVMDCVFQDMTKWDETHPLCKTIRFEDMLVSAEPLVDACRFVGLIPDFLSETNVVDTYNNCSFENLTGRTRGTEDRSSHYRNGVAGDWQNYFSSKHKKEMKERFGTHLRKLGYEADNNW